MKKTTLLFLFCLAAVIAKAQKTVSGKVSSDGEPVVGARVMELDDVKRVINQTTTDANGFYNMSLNSGRNKLAVHAEGFRDFEERLNTRSRLNVALLRKSEIAGTELLDKVHPVSMSYKLLYGHNGVREIPQYIRVEMLNDSLFALVPPIHSDNLSECYPSENVMIFVDDSDNHLMTGVCAQDAFTYSGRPEDVDSRSILTRKEFGTGYIPGDYSASTILNTYPQFIFSTKRLQHMLEHPEKIFRVLIETANKDNFWILYPEESFPKEIQKLITKMQKKLK